jgi:hypothetical protein
LVSKKDLEVVAHLFASESMNTMLAYVFWHWPTSTANVFEYINDLIAFHSTLQITSIPGFHFSHIFHLDKAPWVPQNLLLYEDWYFMESSAVLDTLNLVAVSAARKAPHDQIAHNAAGGIAGLYRLRAGEVDLTRIHLACWFDKPVGMTYEAFFALMLPLISQSGGTLWQRQMVLGPTPEFCWWAPTSPSLPNSISGTILALKLIWSGKAMKLG